MSRKKILAALLCAITLSFTANAGVNRSFGPNNKDIAYLAWCINKTAFCAFVIPRLIRQQYPSHDVPYAAFHKGFVVPLSATIASFCFKNALDRLEDKVRGKKTLDFYKTLSLKVSDFHDQREEIEFCVRFFEWLGLIGINVLQTIAYEIEI